MTERRATKSQLARMRGCAPSLVTKRIKQGRLRVLDDGTIPLDNMDTLAFLGDAAPPLDADPAPASLPAPTSDTPDTNPQKSQETPATVLHMLPGGRRDGDGTDTHEGESDNLPEASALMDMTIRQVVQRYGHMEGYESHCRTLRTLADYERLQIQNRTRKGELVEREMVSGHVIGFLAGMTQKLLRDAPKTLSKEVASMALAGQDREAIQKHIHDNLSTHVLGQKRKIQRALNEKITKDDDDDA